MDERRLQYLAAMRVPVWLLRHSTESTESIEISAPATGVDRSGSSDVASKTASGPVALYLGPGAGGLLLVCDEAALSATPLAADIARCLPEPPVWAWPDAQAQDCRLESIVRERLLTGIAVFGAALAVQLFPQGVPSALGSARVLELPSLAELASQPPARRHCWQTLLAAGLTTRQ